MLLNFEVLFQSFGNMIDNSTCGDLEHVLRVVTMAVHDTESCLLNNNAKLVINVWYTFIDHFTDLLVLSRAIDSGTDLTIKVEGAKNAI